MAKNTNKYVLVDDMDPKKQHMYETIDDLKDDLKESEDETFVMKHDTFNKFNRKSYNNGKEDGMFRGYVLSITGACVFHCARLIIRAIKDRKKK